MQSFDLRVTIEAVAAVEGAALEFLGRLLEWQVAALLGGGKRRDDVEGGR